jgi:hypothetical protein
VTYRDFPNATLESLPKNHEPKPLYYHVEPIVTQGLEFVTDVEALTLPGLYAAIPQVDPTGQPGHHEVARTLKASGMFSDLIETAGYQERGVYCNVSFKVSDRSPRLRNYLV